MRIRNLKKETGGSVLSFVVVLSILTLLRVRSLEPSTSIQSLTVKIASLLIAVSVAYYVYQNGSILGGWILAFGPSLAFTVNLFVPVVAEVTPLSIAAPLISAAIISGVIAGIGFIGGRSFGVFVDDSNKWNS